MRTVKLSLSLPSHSTTSPCAGLLILDGIIAANHNASSAKPALHQNIK